MREKFLIDSKQTWDNYLNFLQTFLKDADERNLEHRQAARGHLQQALGILNKWRVSSEVGELQLLADLNKCFDENLLKKWKNQEVPFLRFLQDSSVQQYATIFSVWSEGKLDNSEIAVLKNQLKVRLISAWKENACEPDLQALITEELIGKCLLAFKSQKEIPQNIDIYHKIKNQILEVWRKVTEHSEVLNFLNDTCLKLFKAFNGQVSDVEDLNQECVRVLLYLWTRAHRGAQEAPIRIAIKGRDYFSIEGHPDLSDKIVKWLDTLAFDILNLVIADQKNDRILDLFLEAALDEYLNNPFEMIVGESLENLKSLLKKTGEELSVSKLRRFDEEALWGVFQKFTVLNLRMKWQNQALSNNDIISWLIANDLPDLLDAIFKLKNLSMKLSFSIEQTISKCSMRSEENETYVKGLVQSVKNKSPIAIDSINGILSTFEVVPKPLQAELENKREIVELLWLIVKEMSLEYKINNLQAFSKVFDRINALRLQIFPDYPVQKFDFPKFSLNVKEYVEWIDKRTPSPLLVGIKAFLEKQPTLKAGDVQLAIENWRSNTPIVGFYLDIANDLNTHFEENIKQKWSFLPGDLKNFLKEYIKPKGPALQEFFSDWLRGDGEPSATASFAPFLAERFFSGKLHSGLSEVLLETCVVLFLVKYEESCQKILGESLKTAWDQETLGTNSSIQQELGKRLIELFQVRTTHSSPTNAELNTLREKAVQMLWKEWSGKKDIVKEAPWKDLRLLAKDIIKEYFKDDKNQEGMRSCLEECIVQVALRKSFAENRQTEYCQALEAEFFEHFHPAIELRDYAARALRRSWMRREAPAVEWLKANDLPYMHQLSVFLMNRSCAYFDYFNAFSFDEMKILFPELAAAEAELRSLKAQFFDENKPNEQKLELAPLKNIEALEFSIFSGLKEFKSIHFLNVKELQKLAPFENGLELTLKPFDKVLKLELIHFMDLSFEALLEFSRGFKHLKILDLSGMSLSCLQILDLFLGAGSPETLYCKNMLSLERFDLSHFSGLKFLNLSNNKLQEVSGKLESLELLNVESCENLTRLSLEAPNLKNLIISGCVKLAFSEMLQYANIENLIAERLPQIIIDLLCTLYPMVEPYREDLGKLDSDMQQELQEHLQLSFKSRQKNSIMPIFHFVSQRALRIGQAFNHFLPVLENKNTQAVQLFLSLPVLESKVVEQVLDEILPFLLSRLSGESLIVPQKLLEWLKSPFIAKDLHQKILEKLLFSIIFCAYDEIKGGGWDKWEIESKSPARLIFRRLGELSERTDLLINYYSVHSNDQTEINSKIFPASGIITFGEVIKAGTAYLLQDADINNLNVRGVLRALFEERVLPRLTSQLLMQSDQQEEAFLESLCTKVLDDWEGYKYCYEALGMAMAKFPSIEKQVIQNLKSEDGYKVSKVISAIIKGSYINDSLVNSLSAHLETEVNSKFRLQIFNRLIELPNASGRFKNLFFETVINEKECSEIRILALEAISITYFENKFGEKLFAWFKKGNISVKNTILKKYQENEYISHPILLEIVTQEWAPKFIINYLKVSLKCFKESIFNALMNICFKEFICEEKESSINEIISFTLEYFITNFSKKDRPADVGVSKWSAEMGAYIVSMIKCYQGFSFQKNKQIRQSRILEILSSNPGIFEILINEAFQSHEPSLKAFKAVYSPIPEGEIPSVKFTQVAKTEELKDVELKPELILTLLNKGNPYEFFIAIEKIKTGLQGESFSITPFVEKLGQLSRTNGKRILGGILDFLRSLPPKAFSEMLPVLQPKRAVNLILEKLTISEKKLNSVKLPEALSCHIPVTELFLNVLQDRENVSDFVPVDVEKEGVTACKVTIRESILNLQRIDCSQSELEEWIFEFCKDQELPNDPSMALNILLCLPKLNAKLFGNFDLLTLDYLSNAIGIYVRTQLDRLSPLLKIVELEPRSVVELVSVVNEHSMFGRHEKSPETPRDQENAALALTRK